MTEFKLVKGKHFTPTGLLTHLNKDFSNQLIARNYSYRGKQKMAYNLNDIHHYVLKGCLPEYLGDCKIKEIYIPFTDLKIIELNWYGKK